MKNIRANVVGASYEPDGELTEKVMTKKDIKKRDEIADAISTKAVSYTHLTLPTSAIV